MLIAESFDMQLVIISGPPNAGKSSTADALCQRYDRMLHIDVSVLRDFLRMGRLRPWDQSPGGRRQRELLIASACDMARRFLDAEYGVVIDDVVTQDDLPLYRDALAGCAAPVHFVVLLPPPDLLRKRERARPTEWQRAGRLEELYGAFEQWGGVARIDPGTLAPELVADRIMALAAEGRARLQ
jgi:tRNA uridine 5-carbamoylmethylation protein Kti12